MVAYTPILYRFTGTELFKWFETMEAYFLTAKLSESFKVICASMYLDKESELWMKEWSGGIMKIDWETFKEGMVYQFASYPEASKWYGFKMEEDYVLEEHVLGQDSVDKYQKTGVSDMIQGREQVHMEESIQHEEKVPELDELIHINTEELELNQEVEEIDTSNSFQGKELTEANEGRWIRQVQVSNSQLEPSLTLMKERWVDDDNGVMKEEWGAEYKVAMMGRETLKLHKPSLIPKSWKFKFKDMDLRRARFEGMANEAKAETVMNLEKEHEQTLHDSPNGLKRVYNYKSEDILDSILELGSSIASDVFCVSEKSLIPKDWKHNMDIKKGKKYCIQRDGKSGELHFQMESQIVGENNSGRSTHVQRKSQKFLKDWKFKFKKFMLGRNLCVLVCCKGDGDCVLYKDPKQTMSDCVAHLIDRMALEEKTGQRVHINKNVATSNIMRVYFIGSVVSGVGSAPLREATAQIWVDMINECEKGALVGHSGIQMIYGIDVVHGPYVYNVTIISHSVDLGATMDPDVVKRIGAAMILLTQVTLEVRATGISYTYAPCFAACRDPRWGRCYESYSEDNVFVNLVPSIQDRTSVPKLDLDPDIDKIKELGNLKSHLIMKEVASEKVGAERILQIKRFQSEAESKYLLGTYSIDVMDMVPVTSLKINGEHEKKLKGMQEIHGNYYCANEKLLRKVEFRNGLTLQIDLVFYYGQKNVTTDLIVRVQEEPPSNYKQRVPFVGGYDKVAACAKHYVGDGRITKRINENNKVADLHSFLSIHMSAYTDAIYKGSSTMMVSYSSWNGEKMCQQRKDISVEFYYGSLPRPPEFCLEVVCRHKNKRDEVTEEDILNQDHLKLIKLMSLNLVGKVLLGGKI